VRRFHLFVTNSCGRGYYVRLRERSTMEGTIGCELSASVMRFLCDDVAPIFMCIGIVSCVIVFRVRLSVLGADFVRFSFAFMVSISYQLFWINTFILILMFTKKIMVCLIHFFFAYEKYITGCLITFISFLFFLYSFNK
jgi:hypothetical protein